MRARAPLRPPTVDRHIAPTARPTAHGSARSMLPLGADSYGAPARRTLRMGAYCWGRLYPPREAIRGPFCSPPYHLRLGAVPAWAEALPTSQEGVVGVPGGIPQVDSQGNVVGWYTVNADGTTTLYDAQANIVGSTSPVATALTAAGAAAVAMGAPGTRLSTPSAQMLGPLTPAQWLYVAGAAVGVILLLTIAKRR